RKGYIAYRAEVIARTEGGNIAGLARETGFRQLLNQAGLDASQATKRWRTRRDAAVRDSHGAMEGVEVGLNESYTLPSGFQCQRPHDPDLPAQERAGCRCAQTFRIKMRQN